MRDDDNAVRVDAQPDDDADADADASPEASEDVVFNILEDDESTNDKLLAVVQADPDTKIYFVQDDSDEDGRFAVDVTIHGRDGGFDYGALLTVEEHTPLELYLALTDEDTQVPAELELAHEWQVEVERPGASAPRDLSAAVPGPQGAFADHLVTGKSSFTCLSWSNFQTYMGSRFASAPGRSELLDSAVGAETLYSPPHPSWWWPTSHVDMVACNYNSSNSPNYNDTIDAELCYVRGLGGSLTTNCGHAVLDDGYYVRRIYGPIAYYRRYLINVDPLSAPALQSYSGIVKRD
ncbi:MAG: hypothetical protein ACPG4T_04380 [Nannocystaceae bacterium]